MKDRNFMVMLGLVVAAGLIIGLLAFRATGGGATTAASGAVKLIGGDPNAPRPSAADVASDDSESATSTTDSSPDQQAVGRDGDSPDIATPEPAAAPPPPPPPPVIDVSSDTQAGDTQS